MPACARRLNKVWRVVECDSGRITKNRAGTAVDGGGHDTEADAKKQADAINASQSDVRSNRG